MSDSDVIVSTRSPRVIDKILARHFDVRGYFWLIPEGQESFKAAVAMVGNDPDRRVFLVDQPGAISLRHLHASGQIKVQAVIDQLVSWFYVSRLKERTEEGDHYFEIPYPECIDRLQRRNVFRVGIPPDVPTRVEFLQPTTSTVWVGRVNDLSAGGCSIAIRPDQATGLDEGVVLPQVKISIEGFVDLTADLVIRNQRIVSDGEWIFGAQFNDLPALNAQQLDRAVMQLQRLMIG